MPVEEYSSDAFFDGPGYALVIGISNYPERENPKNGFPALKYAHRDAADFAAYLTSHGFNRENVWLLTNEGAQRKAIISHLEKLRTNCAQSRNPLIIVFFSGHGWPGTDDRHYLVPHDAEGGENLEASAINNDYFRECLAKMKTDKLVVFIDACHAGSVGGAIKGIKGDRPAYQAASVLGGGDGRYIIASCKPEQKSWEWEEKEHGIFTEHLLELLRGEGDEEIPFEEIRVSNLFEALGPRVKKTALEIHGQDQEPNNEGSGSSSITLAINRRRRNERLKKEDEERKERLEFCDLVCTQIHRTPNCSDKAVVKAKTQAYAEDGVTDKDYGDFCDLFNVNFHNWRDSDKNGEYVSECAKYLIRAHLKVVEARKAQATQKSARVSTVLATVQTPREQQKAAMQSDPVTTTELAKPTENPAAEDNFQKPDKTPELVAPLREALNPPPSQAPVVSPPGGKQVTKKLSDGDCEYVLEQINGVMNYWLVASELNALLVQPVTEADFTRTMLRFRSKNLNDPQLIEMLEEIRNRFINRWPNAELVEAPAKEAQATTLTNMMLSR